MAWKNIRRADFVGYSRGYGKTQSALTTTNGAGGRNVQMFVLTPDGVVLHALPGYWHPEDLLRELRFGQVIARLWDDPGKTREQKERMFRLLHIAELRRQPAETFQRSAWQGFDAHAELQKLSNGVEPDSYLWNGEGGLARDWKGKPILKPLNVLAHQRMVEQPFRTYADFDVAAFVDYGLLHYDNNARVDKQGKTFAGQRDLELRRERAERRRLAAMRK